LAERTDEGEGHETQPMQEQHGALRVDETAMQLGRPRDTRPAPTGDGAPAEELWPARARDLRVWHEDDPMAGKPGPDREVESRVDGGQTRVEPAEGRPDGTAHEHPVHRNTEHVVLHVVLRLVELPVDESDGCPETRDGLTEVCDDIRLVPAHELGTGDRDGRRDLEGGEQVFECLWLWSVVVGEQPEQILVGWFVRCHVQGARYRITEGGLRSGRDELGWPVRGEKL
jgi:hypothetical protein